MNVSRPQKSNFIKNTNSIYKFFAKCTLIFYSLFPPNPLGKLIENLDILFPINVGLHRQTKSEYLQ